jgi:BirA family biotin operon repressor/biotin-[acetyl-CoA-carboxylase] ligase
VRGAALDVYDLAALEAALAGTIFAGKLHFSFGNGFNKLRRAGGRPQWSAARLGLLCRRAIGWPGRGDHAWRSVAGDGLYVSVLLRPQLPLLRLPLLPLAAGLAAAEAIRFVTGLTADLRWPNDLLIAPRKVCGILVEAKSAHGSVDYVIVGLGINVHQRCFDSDLATIATSLDLETGRQSFASGFARRPARIAGA